MLSPYATGFILSTNSHNTLQSYLHQTSLSINTTPLHATSLFAPTHTIPDFLITQSSNMGFRSLVSFVMLAIPIGVTLGILLALDAHRQATGQQPLFQDNSVSKDQYCQKAYGISPTSKGLQYTCKAPSLSHHIMTALMLQEFAPYFSCVIFRR